jgi:dTDP-4-amino-4,6-dideoxygalactose transaminase
LFKIPLHKPQNTIGQEELNAIREVLESGWLTLGPKTIEFERAFAEYNACKFGVASSNCTSALYMSLYGLEIRKGSFVVVPVNTFAATASAVRFFGAEPIFCDVAEDGEIDVAKLETLFESEANIDCVIPVHLYGFPCNMKEITRLKRKYSVKVVEDCAQGQGATFDGKKVGGFGDASCYSFYATKNITTGEGGMLLTNSEIVKKRAVLVRNHCQTKTPTEKIVDWHYDILDLGFNFRMSEIEAAMGIEQLKRIDLIIKSRREIAKKYKEALQHIEGIRMLHDPDDPTYKSAFHLMVITVEKPYPLSRDELYRYLQNKGITTGVQNAPLHYFSYFKNTTKYKRGDFPCAEELYDKILSIPIFPFMTEQEFQAVISALKIKAH